MQVGNTSAFVLLPNPPTLVFSSQPGSPEKTDSFYTGEKNLKAHFQPECTARLDRFLTVENGGFRRWVQ